MTENFKSEPLQFFVTITMAMLLFVTSFVSPLFQIKNVKAAKHENQKATDFFPDFKELKDAGGMDGAVMIDKDNNATIGKDYKFLARMTPQTQVTTEGIGLIKYNYNPHHARKGLSNYEDNVVYAYPLNKNNPGGVSAKYTNVGTYEGQPIDVKVTIEDWKETPYKKGENLKPYEPNPIFNGTIKPEHLKQLQDKNAVLDNGKITTDVNGEKITWTRLAGGDLKASTGITIKGVPGQEKNNKIHEAFYVNGFSDQRYEPMVYFHKKQMGVNIGGIDADITYQFLKAGTDEPVEVQGVFTFADLDSMQGLKIYEDPTNYEDFFLHSGTNIMYQELGDGVVFATGDNATEPDDEKAMVTFTYGPTSKVKFTYYQKGFTEDWHPTYADINQGPAYFEFIAEKPVRTALDNPVKEIVWFDEETNQEQRSNKKNLQKSDEVVKYSIRADIPNEGPKTKYSKFIFEDKLDDRLKFANKDLKVYTAMKDASGKRIDLTSHFDIHFGEETVTAQANQTLLNNTGDFKDKFYGQSLYFEFEVQVKDGVVIPGGGEVTIPNVATIENDVEKKETNEVNIIVKDTEPVDNIVTNKQVNKKEHAYLMNKEEVFEYTLTTLNKEEFDKPLAKAKELVIKDELEEGIEAVKVTKAEAVFIKDGKKEAPKDIKDSVKLNKDKTELEALVELPEGITDYQIVIEFDAQLIKKDIDKTIEAFENMIPNKFYAIDKSVLNNEKLSDKEKEKKKSTSNTVHVSLIEAEKKVEGVDFHEVVNRGDTFNYTIKTPIPQNAKTMIVKDTLDPALKVNMNETNVKFIVPPTVEGRTQELDSIKPVYDEKTNTVTVNLDESKLTEIKKIEELKGAELLLTINAEIKDSADLTNYPKQLIDNKAHIQLDDNREMETNVVQVGETSITKLVNGKHHEDLANTEETFTYEIKTKVPNKAEAFEIYDELEDVLEVKEAELQDYQGGKIKDAIEISKDKRLVSAKLNNKQVKELNGKEVTLIIKAGILPNADITKYPSLKIPNVATVKTTVKGKENTKNSNEVTVRPSDYVYKTVNGKEKEVLTSLHEVFNYQVETVIPSGAKSQVVFQDKLEHVLELAGKEGNVKVTTKGGNEVPFTNKSKGQNVEVVLTKLDGLQGQTVLLSFDAKVKNEVTQEEIAEYYKNSLIPNVASVKVDDGKPNESNKVTVTPGGLTKSVNGKDHHELADLQEEFEYQIKGQIPQEFYTNENGELEKVTKYVVKDEVVEELEIIKDTAKLKVEGHSSNEKDITIKGNTLEFVANETFVEEFAGKPFQITFKAKVKAGADISKYDKSLVPNTADYVINDKTTGSSNTVTVSTDQPVKTINDKSSEILKDNDETFVYKIEATVPSKLKKKSSVTFTDTLEEVLEIVNEDKKTVRVGKEELKFKDESKGNEVKVVTTKGELDGFEGKKVVLEFEAKIKAGADLSAYKDGLIPNIGIVEFDGLDPNETNEVTVTVDKPKKTVNGKDKEILGNKEDKFVFEVSTVVPKGTDKVTITDELVKELEITGEVNKDLILKQGENVVEADIKVEGNKVTVVTKKGEAKKYEGKEITLYIPSKLRSNADLTVYPNNEVPNIATVQFDDKPSIETNEVVVTTEAPTKTVNGKNAEVLKELDEEFTYEIKTKVPSKASELTIVDELVKELEIVDEASIKLTEVEDGTPIGINVDVKDNKITVKTKDGEIEKFVNKYVVLTFDAKIKDGANLSVYENSEVPNIATVQFDDNPATETNEVVVTVDVPTKTVNGTSSAVLKDRKETFTYEIETIVPSDADEVIFTDELVKELEIVGEPKVISKKNEKTEVKADVQVDGNKVVATTMKGEAKKFANERIALVIEAKIKDNADLTVYENEEVPNVATVQFDDNPAVETNEVVVTVDKPKKTVNDKEEHMLSTMDEEFTYDIRVMIPKGKKQVVITDELVNELKVVDASSNLENAKVEIDEQTVTATIEEEHLDAYVGKEFVLTIKAHVKDGVDLSVYKNSQVPNVATVQFDDDPAIETNEVVVIPPNKPVKKVNGKEEYQLKELNEAFEYSVEVMIPRGKKHVEVRDTLVDELEIVEGTEKLYSIDVQPEQKIEDVDMKIDGQTISYELEKELLEKYEGRKLVLLFDAKIKDGADISQYNGKVPNTAEVDIDYGDTVYKTNTVHVNPPKPQDPNAPEQPQNPNNPNNPSNPNNPGNPSKPGGGFLPQMNTKTTIIPLVIGLFLIGGAVVWRKRTKKVEE